MNSRTVYSGILYFATAAAWAHADPAKSSAEWPQYATNPFVIELQHPHAGHTDEGGIFAFDCNADVLMDYVLTAPGRVSVYDHAGGLLWSLETPIRVAAGGDFPGIHHPGAIAGDLDADGKPKIAWLTDSGKLEFHDAATGALVRTLDLPGARAVMVANLRGIGDVDAVVLYAQDDVRGVRLDTGETLWTSTDWIGPEHCLPRVADIDGDGKDEVTGALLIDDDGKIMHEWQLKRDLGSAVSSIDSIVVADIVPGGPLEVAIAEQGGNNQAIVVNSDKILWGKFRQPAPIGECSREIDPDKLAVGDFDPSREGLEVFCRSACGRDPWVFDAKGELIAHWRVDDGAPADWFLGGEGGPEGSDGGIEEIVAIDWLGTGQQSIVAKERHIEESAAIIDPMTGQFIQVFPTRAMRLYAADVSGDHREEVIIVEGAREGEGNGSIQIFWNEADLPAVQPRLWEQQAYRRQKQNWNYYSP